MRHLILSLSAGKLQRVLQRFAPDSHVCVLLLLYLLVVGDLLLG